MSLNLDYIPSHIKTVVIVNDFDYVEGGAAKVAMMTAEALVDAGYNTYLFSAVTKKDAPKIDGVKYVSTNQYPSLSDPNKIRGALNGLFRVRTFTQDDAHIFMREDQIEEEVIRHKSKKRLSTIKYKDDDFENEIEDEFKELLKQLKVKKN